MSRFGKSGLALKAHWDAFLLEGDQDVFYTLYAHYHDYLIYLGNLRGATLDKSKDCINDLFLYVFENRSRLLHIRNHHNYLVTAFIRNLFRKPHFCAEESLELLDLPGMPVYPSVEAEYIQQTTEKEVAEALQAYIGELSESQTKIVYQKFYLGLSYEQIADVNDISVKTAYNTVYNSVGKLRKLIGQEYVGLVSTALSLIVFFF
ncbi:DNA-directed RNA polymerase specialized sigma24 family protein [Mucilaginibacter yixingensis]|uniref:DNA-directed RNA polymerase specialized sigma24 family protein n=1 Tax=Mucilaginibacter yixingensis TaxID=1295612 RepID=A0A2T5JF96_9SPHI|nr:sigma-70 family RNA polymerase sigma factor [Mucilaginibacter yixingensis]PTR01110.1 DNA-directed RNA polymerase specialized sigma24 family protein [Mucilaginibacter yixingensis]